MKVRIRDPFKSKQVEEVKEKWLVIDQFIKTLSSTKVNTCIAIYLLPWQNDVIFK